MRADLAQASACALGAAAEPLLRARPAGVVRRRAPTTSSPYRSSVRARHLSGRRKGGHGSRPAPRLMSFI